MKVITKSDKETIKLAITYAKNLQGGEIIALSGNLGAGKTIFTKGLAHALGVKHVVNSPTFNILKLYPTTNNLGIITLVHIDAYRLKSSNELEALGVQEYFDNPNFVTVIEWPEKIKKILPKKTEHITIKQLNENAREITIS